MYVCLLLLLCVCMGGGVAVFCCKYVAQIWCASHVIGPQGRELSTVVVIEYLSEVHSFLPSTNLV